MKKFVRDFPALKREFQIANKTNRFVDGHTGFHGTLSDWRQRVILNQNMSFTEDAVSSFPHLCKLLQPFVRTKVARRSYFAMMRAGSQLTNHCGGTNLFLRLHLAVEIPQGDIGLVVGGELRRWREGELILFDDSFGHEAWNRSGRDRYIFLIRILHPDILDIERSWLPRIFKRFEATAASKAVFQMFQDKNLK
jgi:aspartyl/asparaginyl beta-hydroxylase (cupin superfamily)